MKRFLPQNILRTLYCSLILSRITYCILVWGFDMDNVIKVQKKSIRTITCSKYNAHTEPLFKNLNLIKLSDLFEINLLKFLYKLNKRSLPPYFHTISLTPLSDIHSYDTRHNDTIPINVTRTVFAQDCIRNKLPSLLNKTSNLITDKIYTHSLEGFSSYAKKFILNTYSEECFIVDCWICNRD